MVIRIGNWSQSIWYLYVSGISAEMYFQHNKVTEMQSKYIDSHFYCWRYSHFLSNSITYYRICHTAWNRKKKMIRRGYCMQFGYDWPRHNETTLCMAVLCLWYLHSDALSAKECIALYRSSGVCSEWKGRCQALWNNIACLCIQLYNMPRI